METRFPSPTGKYHFQIVPWEARMSLWIESPTLRTTEGDKIIFTFSDSNWSLEMAEWLDDERVKMSVRRYPGDHTPSLFEVEVNCLTKQATMGSDTFALNAAESYLYDLYKRSKASNLPRPSSSGGTSRLASIFSRFGK